MRGLLYQKNAQANSPIGLDMTYAFMKHVYGTDELDPIMNGIEYAPHTNPDWDPFSVVHNVSTSYF